MPITCYYDIVNGTVFPLMEYLVVFNKKRSCAGDCSEVLHMIKISESCVFQAYGVRGASLL